ncbi:non-ribosomal peptide synthase/polyketide synthase [Catenovulum sp. SM1970]|uniref:non-ribosomal peptide synthase/polyketide synthase n=1 Tax=Marinifaba aquimaris TaxID=2741323 RepID=UPI0015734462|nr:non-ribosomal peptide synthase/polyketide synthase [Marinifaba aquimaris]NTS77173.1 non-ribosomal peptide synthase/polyketide synthase [Marinifaba aquimaris]
MKNGYAVNSRSEEQQLGEHFKLHPAQENIHLEQLLNPNNPLFNLAWCQRVESHIDPALFQQAWHLLFQHLDVLRTQFTASDAALPLQSFDRQALPEPALQFLDFSAKNNPEQSIHQWMKEDLHQVRDYLSECVFQITLFKQSDSVSIIYFRFHHIINDGVGIYELSELFHKLYDCLANQKSTSWLADLPQYREEIDLAQRYMHSPRFTKDQAYWQQFVEQHTFSRLPVRYESKISDIHSFDLSAQLDSELTAFCQQYSLSPLAVIISIVSLYFSRTTDQNQFAVGTVVHGRRRKGKVPALGMCSNGIPVSCERLEAMSFLEHAQLIAKSIRQAWRHSQFPASHIARLSNEEQNNLCDIQVLYDAFSSSLNATNVKSVHLNNNADIQPLQIRLLNYEVDPGFKLRITYSTQYFNKQDITQLSERLVYLLQSALAKPELAIESLPLMLEREADLLLTSQTRLAKVSNQSTTVHQCFAEQAQNTPDAIALTYQDESLTYQALDEKANKLAQVIRDTFEQGPKADSLIALYLDRSIDMVVSMLAIMKAGAAYVPIDPSFPSERVAFILNDTKTEMVLTQRHLLTELEAIAEDIPRNIHLNALDTLDLSNIQYRDFDDSDNAASDLAYVIYTSGTTGQPKGVMVEHRNLCHLVDAQSKAFNANQCQSALAFASYVFDASVSEIFVSLLQGHQLYICDEAQRQDPYLLGQLIVSEQIELATIPPIFLAQMQLNDLSSLKTLVSAGESPSLGLLEKLSQVCSVINAYGPTEITVCASAHSFKPGDIANNIGLALDNVDLYILNAQGQLQPPGEVGELYIGGAGVARGYLNRDDLTSRNFIANPFSADSKTGARLYRTGDLVRWLMDETGVLIGLEYLGRNDQQVKIRGHRIELSEIVHALDKYQGIEQSAVIDLDEKGNKSLAAYYVAQANIEIDINQLNQYLTTFLPDYMLPASFTQVAVIPRTLNGKLDRAALPKVNKKITTSYQAPQSSTEKQLCSIWQSLLAIEPISVNDNFFRIGGDSIIAIQLTSKLRKEGLDVRVKDIFDNPTVSQLSRFVADASEKVSIDAEQGTLKGDFSLLPVQQWFFDKALDNPHHWNQAFRLTLPSTVTEHALERALSELALQHDMLRCTFTQTATGQVIQRYSADSQASMGEFLKFDVSGLDKNSLFEQLSSWQSSFDIFDGPLWRAIHLTGAGSNQLLFIFHHLVIDAVSWRIISEDLQRLLAGEKLERKTTSYRQWVDAVEHYAKRNLTDVQYWQAVLDDYKLNAPLNLNKTGAEQSECLTLDSSNTASLINQSNSAFNTEINDLLLSALSVACARCFDTEVNHITLEGHGRETIADEIDVSNTLGWFTTLYPVRLKHYTNLDDLIVHTKEMLRAIPSKGLTYGALKQSGHLDKAVLPNISFNYLGQLDAGSRGDWQINAQDCGPLYAESSSELLLNINAFIQDGQLQLHLDSKLPAATTEHFISAYQTAINEIIEHTLKVAQQGGISTPSDYKLDGLSVEVLRKLQQQYQIEAIYPATSLQQGFIFHHLSQPNDDAYSVQLLMDYHQALDLSLYQQAWELASLRFPSLRIAFDWQSDGSALQIITAGASIKDQHFSFIDISDKQECERARLIAEIEQKDRALGFDLSQPGLLRITVIKQSEYLFTVLKTEHHSIGDGWSSSILMQAVHDNYNQLKKQQTPELLIDNAYLLSQEYNQEQSGISDAFWQENSQSWSTVNDLNALFTNRIDLNQTKVLHNPAEQELCLAGEQYQQLKTKCRQLGVTVNVALQFAWHKLIQVYTQDTQTIVGTTVSGRDIPVLDVETSVGLYINTLPLALEWDDNQTVEALLKTIHQKIADINSHSASELGRLQQNGERLFHSLFVFENYPLAKENSTGIETDYQLKAAREKLDYPIAVVAFEKSDALVIKLKYDLDWLDASHSSVLLNQLNRILSVVVEQSDIEHQLISLSQLEQYQTLVKAAVKPCEQQDVIKRFEHFAIAQPNSVALTYENEDITYQALNQKANQLARAIKKAQGQTSGEQLVGLYLDSSPELIISILAVLKAGAAYVPISPSQPQARTQFILEDTQACLVISQTKYLSLLNDCTSNLVTQPQIIELEQFKLSTDVSTDNLDVPISSSNLAYIIYTSGTTGRPKGVMIERRALSDHINAMTPLYGIDGAERLLLFSNIVFDWAQEQIFIALLNGVQLSVLKDNRLTCEAFIDLIIERKLTGINIPPVFAKAVLPTLFADAQLLERTELKRIIIGGEAFPKTVLHHWQASQAHQKIKLFNAYGPTEATVTSHIYQFDVEKTLQTNTLGSHIGDGFSLVLDKNQNIQPVGAVGELYITGSRLARGYLNKPDLTEQFFIANPFESGSSVYPKMYKTGDLVRQLPKGNKTGGCFEYIGRIDNQVKIRGYRIELAEIESVIAELTSVKQVAVIDYTKNDNKYLVAYLVPELSTQLDLAACQSLLAERLPDYMLPSYFVELAHIPVNNSGKLDRSKLPEPELSQNSQYVAPTGQLESALCDIWQHLLGIEKVGVVDNFFALGGNSMAALKLISKVRQALSIDIGLNLIFEYKTIRGIANHIDTEQVINIPRSESSQYPLSFAQQRLRFIEAFEQGSSAYHIPYLVRLDDDVQLDVLRDAINYIADRHPILKTIYSDTHQQVLDDQVNFKACQFTDQTSLLVLLKSEIEQVFDLGSELPFRVVHYQGINERYLLLLWHHIAFDGWSMNIFVDELACIYPAICKQQPIDLPKLPISYGDYASWQHDYIQGEVLNTQIEYWQKTLLDFESLALPTDKPRLKEMDYQGADLHFELPEVLSEQLRELAKEQQTTLYTVLLSAFYIMIGRLSGQSDLIIGTPSDNREFAQTQSIIGFFVNSLALRAQFDGAVSVVDFIAQVHDVVRQAKAHQQLPFEKLLDVLSIDRDPSRHPVFQVLFSLQASASVDDAALPFKSTSLLEDVYSPAKFDLSLILDDSNATIKAAFNYAISLFDETSIARMATMYQLIVQSFVEDARQPIGTISLLCEQDRQLLLQINKQALPYPDSKSLVQLFSEQALATPDNTALILNGNKLSYAELEQRSNQLAHYIGHVYQQQKAQPLTKGSLIATYLDRSFELVISMLAILKSGAAYVPISSDYPAERCQFMLEDTAASMVLTEAAFNQRLTLWLEQSSSESILIDVDHVQVSMQEKTPLAIPVTSTDLAYVMYTSGTTGKPKGVKVPHRAVVSLVCNNNFAELDASDVFLQLSNPNFDAATFEIWAPLCHGASLVLPQIEGTVSVAQLAHYLEHEKVSVLWLTRALFDHLYNQDHDLFASLQYLLVGGEALTANLIDQLIKQPNRPHKILNGYGPTESTTFTTIYDCDQFNLDISANNSVPIGQAINTRQLYVLSPEQQLLPIGAKGELYISGAGLATGYLNRETLTAERFIENVFASEDDLEKGYTRLYKTGDLVRWLTDEEGKPNVLEYLGRNDCQVKIRGYRIELGEAEVALCQLDGVEQAIALDYQRAGNNTLVAYICAQAGVNLDLNNLRMALSESLPDYMVPASFTLIDAIPLTLNGKLDRAKLPEPVFTNSDDYVAPRNELETLLCQVWQEVLGIEKVGIQDNFFRIGGDSIISIQLTSSLRKHDLNVQVKDIFNASTVEKLAVLLAKPTDSVSIEAEQGELTGEFSLLPIQQWFFDKSLSNQQHWNQAFMLQIPADIKVDDIHSAIASLTEQHDILRCVFNGSDRQEYLPTDSQLNAPLVEVDVSSLDSEQFQQKLTQLQSHFDIERGPLWQIAHLTGFDDGSCRLFFAFHHLIIDAVSWRIIADDMQSLLTGQSLPEKTSSYRQWVDAINSYAKKYDNELDYWESVISEADCNVVAEPAKSAITLDVKLDSEKTDQLLQQSNNTYNTEINDLLLSALCLAAERTFKQDSYLVKLEGHGREAIDERLDVSRTVGWFTSLFPVKLTTQSALSDLIIHTKEMLRAIPNKGIGFGAMQNKALNCAVESLQISFNYLGQLDANQTADWQINAGNCGQQIIDSTSDDVLLNINGAVQLGCLSFRLDCRFDRELSQHFATHFEQALIDVIQHTCDVSVDGGQATPSDYQVENLSIPLLKQLQQTYQIEAIYPATSLQQGFIYHHLSQPNDDAYRVQLLIDYHQDLDIQAYKKAWSMASMRFPILRTAFNWQQDVIQIISSQNSIGESQFNYLDISDFSEHEREQKIAEIQEKDRLIPFDLSQPGLIRFTIIKQAESYYTLLKTEHHSITDGWSTPVLMQAVHDNYNELVNGRLPQFQEDKAYTATQAYLFEQKETAQTYWQQAQLGFEQANDINGLLSQTIDLTQVRAVEQPAAEQLRIEGDDYAKLKSMCLSEGVTINVALQFAWHKLLQTYCRDSQTIVGTTVSGRDIPVEGIDTSVGLYINTLPLWVNWQDEANVLTVLQQIQKNIADINTYSGMSLGQIQQNGERLFHSLFVFENYPLDKSVKTQGIEKDVVLRAAIEKTDYPLSLIAYEESEALVVNLKYSEQWLTLAQSKRLLNQLNVIIEQISQSVEQPHTQLSLLSNTEVMAMLDEQSQPDRVFAQHQSLAQLFEQQVDLTPNNVALVYQGKQLTYAELNGKANQLARYIKQLYQEQTHSDISPDTLIGLYFDTGLEMIISMLAVLKTGAAYVPISPQYPEQRTQVILQDTAMRIIVTEQKYLSILDTCIDTLALKPGLIAADNMAPCSVEKNLPLNIKSTDLAYVIFTSGTTGKPKGVCIENASVLNTLHAMSTVYDFNEEQSKATLFSSYTFDVSVSEIFNCIGFGGELHILPQHIRTSSDLLVDYVKDNEINFVFVPPSVLSVLPQVPMPSVKKLIFAGDKCEQNRCVYWAEHYDLYNFYGPTEASIYASGKKAQVHNLNEIGQSLTNGRLYVLDPWLNILPPGVAGELYIGGAGLARGYFNRPDLTDDKFIANPFITEADRVKGFERIYKTGDLVRWRVDKQGQTCDLEYLGRNDNQVKIRGFRIELGEIENALAAHDSIQQAVVIDYEREGSKCLVAYIILNPEQVLDRTVLRNWLLSSMPEYMLPASYCEITHLPLTINGKLDRRALPEPEFVDKQDYVAPRSALERSIATIWQEVLGLNEISIHDNFFRIGGDSIISIQLTSRLRKEGYNLQVKDIFSAPNIAQLAVLLAAQAKSNKIEAEQGVLTGDFNLLPVQQWFFEQPLKQPNHWNQAFKLLTPASVSSLEIKQALSALVEQHDILTGQFYLDEGPVPMQRYTGAVSDDIFDVVDISEFSQASLQQKLTDWQSAFDIYKGPLWTAKLLTGFDDKQHRLFFAFHHLVIDAVSWRIIADDMQTLLTGGELGAKTSSYRQWVKTVKSYANQHQDEAKYWQAINAKTQALPMQSSPSMVELALTPELTTHLLVRANKAFNTEINDLLLSALSKALPSTSLNSSNVITLEGHGREDIDEHIDVSKTLGWFTTMYPVELQAYPDLTEQIIKTKEMLRAIPNKGIGFGALCQSGKVTQASVANISFNYLGQLDTHSDSDDFSIIMADCGNTASDENTSTLALNINGAIQNSRLYFRVESRLGDEQTHRFIAAFKTALTDVIEHTAKLAQSAAIKTPSDYHLTISYEHLTQLQNKYDVEAIYPATSLQQGFIYHHLSQPQDDAYRVQLMLDYCDGLDIEKYQQAWRLASERFSALRMAFDWQQDILQIVTRDASISSDNFSLNDISQFDSNVQAIMLEKIQQQDRAVAFDLSKPGLIRFTIIKRSDTLFTVLKTEHHSICDGWSSTVVMQVVHSYYNQLMAGQVIEVTPESTYGEAQDYYRIQKSAIQKYWHKQSQTFEQTNDINPLLSQAIDLNNTSSISKPGERSVTITGDGYKQLKTMCAEQGVTVNAALQFAWHKLLQTYTQDDQTIVGTTVSGRDIPVNGIETSVGLYINTLPLSVDWFGTERCIDVLRAISQNIAELNSYSAMNLSKLQQQGERLFHSLFVFENYPQADKSADGIESTVKFNAAIEKADYPLSVLAFEQNDGLVVGLKYGVDWLTEHQSDKLLTQLTEILSVVSQAPEQAHQDIVLVSEQERHQQLVLWNETRKPYPHQLTLHQAFEAQVELTPNQPAICFGELTITYDELNQRANKLARYIRDQYAASNRVDISADTLIALYLDRGIEMVVAILAVLKAGAAYVPISPDYPQARTRYVLEDSQASLIIGHHHYVERLHALEKCPAFVDIESAFISHQQSNNLALNHSSSDLAYILYTSGTTGTPKGVMIEHRNAMHLAHAQISGFAADTCQRALAFASYVFDASVSEIFVSLLSGHQVFICSEEQRKDPMLLGQYIQQHKVELATLPPIILSQLNDAHLASVKTLVSAGESASAELLDRLSRSCQVINAYGPTEASVCASLHYYQSGDLASNIGKAIDNAKLYVLDKHGQLLPNGVAGELYIGGEGVGRGYLNRPELTQERFIKNTFCEGRLYKTGDLVRWLDSGELQYLGRNDSQVKIRGNRIELGEIESQLLQYPDIKHAAVIDYRKGNNVTLAAYLVLEAGCELVQTALSSFLSQSLTDYMLPTSFNVLEQLPLTINGKLNRKALPEPTLVTKDYVAAGDELESLLCEIWQRVLGLEKVGVNDNFFHIGGDSILSIQLTSQLRKEGFSLQVKDVVSAPTVAKLAALLAKSKQKNINAEQGVLTGAFPLMPIQKWFFDNNYSQPNHWNQAFTIAIPEAISAQAIQEALNALAKQHDMLRCCYQVNESGQMTQCYLDSGAELAGCLQSIDVTGLSDSDIQRKLTDLQSHFDITKGPLWQATHLYGFNDGHARLFFAFHHLIIDAVSWRIVIEDMRQLLKGKALAAKTSSYRQFSEAMQTYAKTRRSDAQYWQSVLASAAQVAPATVADNQATIELSAAHTEQLLQQANAGYHTDINDLLLSVLARSLFALTGHRQNLIILEGHGRESIDDTLDVSNTIGWFTSRYPVVLSNQNELPELIVQTKNMLRAIPDKGLSYGALVNAGVIVENEQAVIGFNYLGQLDTTGQNQTNDWQILNTASGQQVSTANKDKLLLNINGGVQNGRLSFNVQSKFSVLKTLSFKTNFEKTLVAVIEHTLQVAESGGVKTSSDFSAKTLSDDGLKALQQRLDKNKKESGTVKKTKSPKNIIRI